MIEKEEELRDLLINSEIIGFDTDNKDNLSGIIIAVQGEYFNNYKYFLIEPNITNSNNYLDIKEYNLISTSLEIPKK